MLSVAEYEGDELVFLKPPTVSWQPAISKTEIINKEKITNFLKIRVYLNAYFLKSNKNSIPTPYNL